MCIPSLNIEVCAQKIGFKAIHLILSQAQRTLLIADFQQLRKDPVRVRCLMTDWKNGLTIRHKHLRQTQAIKQLSPIITHIMQHHSLSPRESQPKPPLLPLHQIALHSKRHAFWLVHNQRLKIRAWRRSLQLMVVLFGFMWNVGSVRVDG